MLIIFCGTPCYIILVVVMVIVVYHYSLFFCRDGGKEREKDKQKTGEGGMYDGWMHRWMEGDVERELR